jgi:cytidylate kinase
MSAQIVLFAGPICSGKSTLSKAVAKKLAWRWVGFADYLRHVATDQGLPTSRSYLQELGQQFIERGWLRFCQGVLDFAQWSRELALIVDGVRHVEAVNSLRSLTAPSPLTVVFVETPLQIRKERFATREPGSSFDVVDSHPVERDSGVTLRLLADHVVDGSAPVDANVHRLIQLMALD